MKDLYSRQCTFVRFENDFFVVLPDGTRHLTAHLGFSEYREAEKLLREAADAIARQCSPVGPSNPPTVEPLTPAQVADPTPEQTRAAWAFVASTLSYCKTQMRDGFDQRVIEGAHVVALAHARRG